MASGQFFALCNAGKHGALHLAADTLQNSTAVFLGEAAPPGKVRYRHHSGGNAYDFIGTTHVVIDLMSDNMRQVLEDVGATGWGSFPAEVHHKKLGLLPGYSGLVVTGRCGPIDFSKCRVELRPPPVPEGKPMRIGVGLVFDLDRWDGSDLFVADNYYVVLVTQKVETALVQAGISNIRLEPVSEFEIPLIDRVLRRQKRKEPPREGSR